MYISGEFRLEKKTVSSDMGHNPLWRSLPLGQISYPKLKPPKIVKHGKFLNLVINLENCEHNDFS